MLEWLVRSISGQLRTYKIAKVVRTYVLARFIDQEMGGLLLLVG